MAFVPRANNTNTQTQRILKMQLIKIILFILAVAIVIVFSPVLLVLAVLKTMWSFCKGGFERIEREQRGL